MRFWRVNKARLGLPAARAFKETRIMSFAQVLYTSTKIDALFTAAEGSFTTRGAATATVSISQPSAYKTNAKRIICLLMYIDRISITEF